MLDLGTSVLPRLFNNNKLMTVRQQARGGDINNAFLFPFSLSVLLAASISLRPSLGVFLRQVERQQIDSES